MAVNTIEELIKQGVYLAGVTYNADDTKQLKWMKEWLRSVALGWPWPETISNVPIVLAQGSSGVVLGGVAANLTGMYIHRLMFPIFILYGEDIEPRPITQQAYIANIPLDNLTEGTPDKASYTRDYSDSGNILVTFNRKAKTAFNLQLTIQFDPAVDYTIADVPWYPNDETIKYAIAWKASEAANGPAAETTLKLEDSLAQKFRNDKVKFGNIENFTMELNRKWKK